MHGLTKFQELPTPLAYMYVWCVVTSGSLNFAVLPTLERSDCLLSADLQLQQLELGLRGQVL